MYETCVKQFSIVGWFPLFTKAHVYGGMIGPLKDPLLRNQLPSCNLESAEGLDCSIMLCRSSQVEAKAANERLRTCNVRRCSLNSSVLLGGDPR